MNAQGEIDDRKLQRTRSGLAAEVALEVGDPLSMTRTALRLIDLIKPRLADWAVIVIPDITTGELMMVGDGASSGVVFCRAEVEGMPLGRILWSGKTEHVEVTEIRGLVPIEPFLGSANETEPAEALGVGITARGTTLGALIMLRRSNDGFCAEDVAFAESIADSAALALDSARLHEERSRIAAVLQHSLRPPVLPEIPGLRLAARYRPAAEHLDIGGDFYEITGSDCDWLIALGDVCGKGIEAAALTGQARQIMRTAAYFDHHPASVLGAMNAVLGELLYESPSSQFVTVLCARFLTRRDGAYAIVEVATAGHHPPLVLRHDGRVEQLDVFGTAAGVVTEMYYGTTTCRLEEGETMLMFTDGIDEAWGASGQYGLERLQALLPAYAGAPAEVICEAVEYDVMDHLDGRPHDDMALLAATCMP
ncbi:PP2C family protein-serine/threonine phosphatase [Mycobacterium sp. IDR2000157661]|uniref:PP2C family protein-serine/threonine phosphatase n=1 Tax=Mycobacterium sp. IDR2000157661 TaxID=2867005 RepID=UPI001EEAFCF7|nr:SpoIIE family protein phosphatase [Mycobacterium sp. IDR2000157661]